MTAPTKTTEVTIKTSEKPLPDPLALKTTEGENIVENVDGTELDKTQAAPEDLIRNKGRNTEQSPAPRNQSDDGATDPMQRDVAESPGAAPEPKPAQLEYVLAKPYNDGMVTHPKGAVVAFYPDEAPSTASLLVR